MHFKFLTVTISGNCIWPTISETWLLNSADIFFMDSLLSILPGYNTIFSSCYFNVILCITDPPLYIFFYTIIWYQAKPTIRSQKSTKRPTKQPKLARVKPTKGNVKFFIQQFNVCLILWLNGWTHISRHHTHSKIPFLRSNIFYFCSNVGLRNPGW